MNSLLPLLLEWTDKKQVLAQSPEEIKSQAAKILKTIKSLDSETITPEDIEILCISMELIEEYCQNKTCLATFEELKSCMLDLITLGEYLYLRPMTTDNQINAKISGQINGKLVQHQKKKSKPFVVRTFAPKFYEEKDER